MFERWNKLNSILIQSCDGQQSGIANMFRTFFDFFEIIFYLLLGKVVTFLYSSENTLWCVWVCGWRIETDTVHKHGTTDAILTAQASKINQRFKINESKICASNISTNKHCEIDKQQNDYDSNKCMECARDFFFFFDLFLLEQLRRIFFFGFGIKFTQRYCSNRVHCCRCRYWFIGPST